jgi:hypothetical protein
MKNSIKNISIILPFHVVDSYLNEAIKSCLDSKGCKFELNLVDTRPEYEANTKILNILDDRVKIYRLPNADYISALKFGLHVSSAKIIGLMNSDDLVSERRFAKQIAKLNDTNTNICLSNIKKFRSNKNIEMPSLLGEIKCSTYSTLFLLIGSYGANATWVFQKSWAIKNKVFSHELDKSDWHVAIRVFPNSKISYENSKLYFYRMHKNQRSKNKNIKKKELIKLLINLNNKFDLPKISFKDIEILAGIARPNFKIINHYNYHQILIWLDCYLDLINKTLQVDHNIYNLLQRRRLLLALCSKNFRLINVATLVKLIREVLKSNRSVRW